MTNLKNNRRTVGMKALATIAGAALFVSACAGPGPRYTPYPTQGKSAIDYQADISACQSWARMQPGASPQRGVNKAAEGAVVLGLLGAVLGWAAGDARLGGLVGAGVGATAGGVQGSQQAQAIYDRAYADCLRAKGYTVQ